MPNQRDDRLLREHVFRPRQGYVKYSTAQMNDILVAIRIKYVVLGLLAAGSSVIHASRSVLLTVTIVTSRPMLLFVMVPMTVIASLSRPPSGAAERAGRTHVPWVHARNLGLGRLLEAHVLFVLVGIPVGKGQLTLGQELLQVVSKRGLRALLGLAAILVVAHGETPGKGRVNSPMLSLFRSIETVWPQ